MNRFSKNEFAIFISLLPKDITNQNLFIFTGAGVVPCGGRKTFSRISPYCSVYFWSFERDEVIFLSF